jgi:uncharacterized protein YciI
MRAHPRRPHGAAPAHHQEERTVATFSVIYDYIDDEAKRDEHRPAHRDYLRSLHEQGKLIVSGPHPGTPPSALVIMNAADAEEVTRLLDQDPFWTEGVIAERTIREWDIVIGSLGG